MAAFNFHRRRTRHWWYVGATLVAAAFFAVFFVAGAGAVSGSPSGFESGDGDMVLTSLDGSHTDWNCFVGSDNFQPGTPNPNCKVKTGASHVTGDASGEVQWVPGQKFDILCPALNNGNNPPKDEFTDLTEFDEVAGNGDLFFYGSAIRSTANGNTSGDVEFNQKAGDGVTTAGCRTAGDRLVAYDFLNGGTTLSFHVLTYIDAAHPNLGGNNGTCFVKTNPMPCWGATVITVASNLFDGQANQSPITAANNGISGTALAAQQWSEFGVNLTQALGASSNNPLPCFPQQVWESRSSGSSFVSNPQDIEFLHVSTCGSITIIKHTDPRNLNQNFSYSASGGNISPTSFKLNDQSALTISAISTGTTTSTITTATNNGFAVGDTVGVTISGSNSTPKVDGPYTATITGANTFTIPLAAPVTTAGTAGSATTNTELYPQLSAGSYTVNEGAEPPGFSPESLTCIDSGGNSTSTSGVTASIAVAANGSTVCTYVNHQNLASMKTQVSSTSVFPGNAVHDTATVTGNNPSATPSGNVTFYLCGPLPNAAGCSSSDSTRALVGTGTLSGSGGTASADSPNVNAPGSELGAGIYCFEAAWPGDNNYPTKLDVTSATNECFTVSQIRTTTVTTPSVGPNGILVGSSVSDNAIITALQGGGGPITGTVTFYLCSPSQTVGGACPDGSGTLVSSTTSLTDRGTTPPSASANSDPVTVNLTGTWCWRAVYDPGSNHNYTGSEDAGSTECFLVTDTTTSTSQQVWYPNDSASVSADASGDTISGTLTLQLYTGADCVSGNEVAGQLYSSGDQTGTATISVDSNKQTSYGVSSSANVSWKVVFTSDDPNVAGSHHCENSSVTITN
jgi:hypothetical protein